ncbi:hypothetical protein NEOLEDRAFT_1127723 [Neolentinus lepideus HHB14362 ss-1]|uniref:Uncharacterized protein n=1 Tax=Neolentinus lepideus HHB14362 ss-1 TaxID=1314782 RepID=A0A165VLD3_9AGAM|nr:hypothetical protein NEOLEDRAFT_1127723 [Neolentinus lepideus HHB14362 ss-1]
MALRLTNHLESLAPPPAAQVTGSKPWRGTFTVMTDHSNPQVLYVSAAETDGDNRANLWPANFVVQAVGRGTVLSEVNAWVQRNTPPLCMFMPERLDYVDDNRANEANFRALASMLLQNQAVAFSPWHPANRLPGAGILIYPTPSSNGLLVGAIFLTSSFPDFLGATPALYRQPIAYQDQYQNGQTAESGNGYYQYM